MLPARAWKWLFAAIVCVVVLASPHRRPDHFAMRYAGDDRTPPCVNYQVEEQMSVAFCGGLTMM